MLIFAKIGTGPQQSVRLKNRRTLPKHGEVVKFKSSIKDNRWENWKEARVDDIKDLGYSLFYLSMR